MESRNPLSNAGACSHRSTGFHMRSAAASRFLATLKLHTRCAAAARAIAIMHVQSAAGCNFVL